MGEENSKRPRTLGDYSRPSHKGYQNAIELSEGAKVSPLRSDTIRLVQNGCAFQGLMSEDAIQHLKDFLRIVDSINLNGATRNTTRLRLLCFSFPNQAIKWLDRLPAGSISTWDDLTTRFLAQFFPPGRTAKFQKDILMFQQHQDESLCDAWTRFKDLLLKVPHHGRRLIKLKPEEAWKTIEDLAQYEEGEWNDPTFSKKGSPDYIDATLEQELESIECRVESLMRNEVLLEYEVGFTFPKRPYQEELETQILKLIDDQEDQIRQLEKDMRKTKDTFMCLAESLIAILKVKIEAKQAHSIKIEKITKFPTHTPTVTLEILKPSMMNMVSMITNTKPTIYRYPYQHLNFDLKMPILHSFEENKLEYEDKDEAEIKMMGTEMDIELLEHNLHKNDITLSICHNFPLTLNPPIKLKD
nr:zinc finger, CCHC-type [Tanacetum cinerariifolium]